MPARSRPTSLYYALVVPGLEDIASEELRGSGAVVTGHVAKFDRRDSLVLFSVPDARSALECGTLEDVFQVLLDVTTPSGPRAANALARQLDAATFARASLTHHALQPRRHGRTYKVVARIAGRHPFRREDLERAFERAVGALLPRWSPTRGGAALEVWVHVVGDRTVAGIRLSDDELAQRRYKVAHLPASLKPTVARALVMLTDPRPGDVFLDPMCGAGTILRERAGVGRSRTILGGDLESHAVAATRSNVGRGARIARWDATRLPIGDASIDAIGVNPPYGRQHTATEGLDRLYARTMREFVRVLRSGGRAVVLTGEPAILLKSMPRSLEVRARHRLLLRGLAVTAFVLHRP